MKVDKALRLLIMLTAAAVALGSVTVAERAMAEEQRFVPHPKEAYADFAPLREPRANVPVGALWVQGYGPHGEGAAADNLETIRGVNSLTMGRNLQVSLTLGLLNFLGIDPGLRNQITARFSDLSIVRVKDLTKLTGPAGEPRIYEALRAGSITITTDSNLSLNLNVLGGAQGLPVTGRGGGGRTRTYTLDARDMFIGMRVVTPTAVTMHRREINLGRSGAGVARLDEYQVSVDAASLKACIEQANSPEAVGVCTQEQKAEIRLSRPSSGNALAISSIDVPIDASAWPARVSVPLPVPLSDDRGGLLTSLQVDLSISVRERRSERGVRQFELTRDSQAIVALKGSRLATAEPPDGWNW